MQETEEKTLTKEEAKPLHWKFFLGVESLFLSIISAIVIYYGCFYLLENIVKPTPNPDNLIGRGFIVAHLAMSNAIVILMKGIIIGLYFKASKWNFSRYILYLFSIYIGILFYHVNSDVNYNDYSLTESNFAILISIYFIVSLLFDKSEIAKYRSEYSKTKINGRSRLTILYKDMVFFALITLLSITVWLVVNLFRVVI